MIEKKFDWKDLMRKEGESDGNYIDRVVKYMRDIMPEADICVNNLRWPKSVEKDKKYRREIRLGFDDNINLVNVDWETRDLEAEEELRRKQHPIDSYIGVREGDYVL